MARIGRLLILGSLAFGLLLVIGFTLTSGNLSRAYGQTGYGSDTVPPSQLATSTVPAGAAEHDDLWFFAAGVATMAILSASGGAVYWRTHNG